MRTTEYLFKIIEELECTAGHIMDEQAEQLAAAIVRAQRIFVAGAGRSGLMIRAFAMRLMHLGFTVYVVGETVTPALTKTDLLIIGSGSGETKSLTSMAGKAKSLGALLAAVTIYPESTIGQFADIVVKLPGAPKDKSESSYETVQPMGSLFEQTMLLFFDSLIVRLMESKKIGTEKMFDKHANLE